MDGTFVTLTAENLKTEHLCCIIRTKKPHPGVEAKRAWLAARLPDIGLTFLVLGGLFYTLGIFFYVWKSRQYTHAVWHFFVLSGTVMHFFAVLYSCVLR